MYPAFADNGDCWFIFCMFEKWFEPKQEKPELTVEELYIEQAEKGKQKLLGKVEEKIAELKEYKKTVSGIEKQTDAKIPQIQNAIDQELELLEGVLFVEEDQKKNPAKYFNKENLVNIAMEYYKVKPDGTSCDDDRRWVETRGICIREDTARKLFYTWDLEWIRDHPEIYLK